MFFGHFALGFAAKRLVPQVSLAALFAAAQLAHRLDMPLYPGSPKFGLGLWNAPVLEKGIEIAMYAAGLAIYLRATSAKDGIGRWALWSAALVLSVLTVVWTWWADRHRMSTNDQRPYA